MIAHLRISSPLPGRPRARLLSPYPGAKNPRLYPVRDRNRYDCWLAPFAGSGEQEAAIARLNPQMPIVAADADPAVRCVWEAWAHEQRRARVTMMVEEFSGGVRRNSLMGFEILVNLFNALTAARFLDLEESLSLAAASIVLRRLTFGGVLRINQQGQLNVALSSAKLKAFMRGWRFEWPTSPQVLTVCSNWQEVPQMIPGNRAIAIVDPPYWAPGTNPRVNGGMTAAYACHNPQGASTLQMHLDCIEQLLATGKVARIVAFNYWGEWREGEPAPIDYGIHAKTKAIADRFKMPVHFSNLGGLTTMNRGNGRTRTNRFEGCWEIGGDRLYPNLPPQPPNQLATSCQQLSFLF